MNDKLYVVYNNTEVWIDDWSEQAYDVMDKYFTDEDQAELCADYLNMSTNGSYFVKEVTNGNDIDYESLIEECEKRQREKELAREKKNREYNIDNLALFKSRVDGSDYGENLKEFKEQYADYIENGAEWSEW